MLFGGLSGASYSNELGDAVNKNLKQATDYIGTHGNAYDLNPFGGASDKRQQAEEAENHKKIVSQYGEDKK